MKLNEYMDLIIKIDKKDKVSEEELFGKLKEFLDKNKGEYPQVALISMIIDSFETGSSIFKLKKELEISEIQTNFLKK